MKLKFVALVAAVSLLGGCSTFHVAPYGATVSNVETIKSYNLKPVAVGKFQAVKPVASIPCRAAGPVTAAPSFEGYIEKAFTDELRLAGIYDAASPLVLTGKLEKLDFSSGMSDGNWSFTVTLTNARNESLTTVSKSEF